MRLGSEGNQYQLWFLLVMIDLVYLEEKKISEEFDEGGENPKEATDSKQEHCDTL